MLTLPCRHGSWDSPQDQIGSFVFGHTNKTEIEDSLNLFWGNGVPADKINLGIGFYGRSYTLEDKSCTEPGCPFSEAGQAGKCTVSFRTTLRTLILSC
jgi:chitinase